jgi:hypothetical protein
MNSVEYSKLLEKIRQQIIDGKYTLSPQTEINLDQMVFWDRLTKFFIEEYDDITCGNICDLCRERLNHEIEYITNQIDKYLAGEFKNVKPTLVLGYQSTDKSYGIGVFVYEDNNHPKAWSADKNIQTNVQQYLDKQPLHSSIYDITEAPIENFILVDIQRNMLYERELQNELSSRNIIDDELKK